MGDVRELIAEARARADYIKRLPVEKYSSSSRIMYELADALEALNAAGEVTRG